LVSPESEATGCWPAMLPLVFSFWATVTRNGSPYAVWPLSVCNVGVLWPNGWMDQDSTWPRRYCVRWGPAAPLYGTCLVAKWLDGSRYHLVVGTEVSLSSGDIVLDGDLAPPHGKGHSSPPTFWRMSVVAKRLDGSGYHLYRGRALPRRHCAYRKGHSSPHFFGPYCSGTVTHLSSCWALVNWRHFLGVTETRKRDVPAKTGRPWVAATDCCGMIYCSTQL